MRGKGLGSRALAETEKKAKKLGCKTFGAWTNSKKAERFYRANRFKKGKKLKKVVVDGKKIYTYPKGSIFYYKKL